MAYTTPNFNLLCDVWNSGHVPGSDTPDFENVACQLYVNGRTMFDVQPCDLETYQPAIAIRLPPSIIPIWSAGQIFEVPAESGFYYRARFKERMHLGFPNQYLAVWVVQCGADGIPLLNFIEGAVPCGGPTPGDNVGNGAGEFRGVYFSTGESTNGPGEDENEGSGEGLYLAEYSGDGNATNSGGGGDYVGAGEGTITATYAGEGEADSHGDENEGEGSGNPKIGWVSDATATNA